MKNIPIFFLIICFRWTIISTELYCTNNKCYQTINKSYMNLSHLITTFSKVNITKKPEHNQDLLNILNEIKSIWTEIGRNVKNLYGLNETRNNADKMIRGNAKQVRELEKELQQYSFNEIIQNAKQNETKLKEIFKLAENSSKMCKKAHEDYLLFQQDFKDISKNYKKVQSLYENSKKKVTEANNEINELFLETISLRKQLNELDMNSNIVNNKSKITTTLQYLEENFQLLDALLRSLTLQWNRKFTQYFNSTLKDIANSAKDYEKNIEMFDVITPNVNDESRKLLIQFKRYIELLEAELENTNFTREETVSIPKDLKSYLENNEAKLAFYRTLFENMPTNLEESQKILQKLQEISLLVQEMDELDVLLKRLRKNRDEIVKIDCVAAQEPSDILA